MILRTLVLALCFFVLATTAEAHPRQKAKIERLQDRLEKKTHKLTTLRARLTVRTAERDAALATSSQPATDDPAPLQGAITTVTREVAYAEKWLASQNVSYSHDALVAHSALSYVSGHVSAPLFGWMYQMAGLNVAQDVNEILKAGAGICGHSAMTLTAIVQHFGLQVRNIAFYHEHGSHVAIEIYHDGAWHFYDPTYGAVYKDGTHVLSVAEMRAHPDPASLLSFNRTLLGYELAVIGGWESRTDLRAEMAPTTRVAYW